MNGTTVYLGALESAQRGIDEAISAIEERLSSARMMRLAPVPLGDVGRRRNVPSPRFEAPRIILPRLPGPPPDLASVAREIGAAVSGRGAAPDAPVAVERRSREPAPIGAHEVSDGPRSLVHREPVVGNRWIVELIASAELRLPTEGTLGIRDLFPVFDPGPAASFLVEVSLHRLRRRGSGDAGGLDIVAVAPGLVSAEWPYRVLSWSSSARGELLALGLPGDFSSCPANTGQPERPGLVREGEAFAILALDPRSAVAAPRRTSEPVAVQPVDGPGPSPPPPRQASETNVREPADPAVEHRRDDEVSRKGRTPVLPPGAGRWLLNAWERWLEAGGAPTDTPGFLEAVADFEKRPERSAPAGEGRGAADFGAWCRHRNRERETGAPGTAERPTMPARPSSRPAVGVRFSATWARLRRKFKHAPDFGVTGRYGREAMADFSAALHGHVAGASERRLVRHRGRDLVAHIAEECVVLTTTEGVFVTGYWASPEQVEHLRSRPEWRCE